MDFIIVVTAFAALAGIVLPLALMLTVGLWGKERAGGAERRGGRKPARGRGSGQPASGGGAPG